MKFWMRIGLVVFAGFATAAHANGSQSGVILPETIEALPAGAEAGTPNPLDAHRNYSANGEVVTIYVFRATQPNAALWFERADAILKMTWVSRGLGSGEPATTFTLGGSPTPNGLRRTYTVSGAHKSTGLSVVQVGQWIVKIRSSSASLDVPGQNARMNRILDAIKTREPIKASNPLTLPEACPAGSYSVFDSLGSEAVAKPKGEAILMAGMIALTAASEAGGGEKSLAADPTNYCRGTLEQSGELAALYWPKNKANKGWTVLLADSGRSLSGLAVPVLDGKKSEEGGMLTANKLDRVDVLMLTKNGLPLPDAAIMLGLNHIMRGGPALTSVEYGTATINVSLPK